MNRRLAAKRALLATGRFPRPVPAVGLFDATDSIALAVGVIRPRVLIDPRAYGEHRALREYVLYHEAFHVIAQHTRMLFAARWLGILVTAAVMAMLTLQLNSIVLCSLAAGLGAWVEARLGLFTMSFRAAAETEADDAALSVMRREHFASAVTALFSIQKRRRGPDGMIDRFIYGATAAERLARVGVFVEAAK